MREDFDELRVPAALVERYPPDRFELFDALGSQVSDELLKRIAQADYGQEVQKHFAGLKRVRAKVGLGKRLDWHPREVLELVRWSSPNEWPTDDRHLATAFCACALIVVPWDGSDEGFLEADSTGALLATVPQLDRDLVVPLLKLLIEMLVHAEPWEEDYLYVALGLVFLLYRMGDPDWVQLGEWFAKIEREILPWHSSLYPNAQSILEIRSTVSHERFHRLVVELLDAPGVGPEFRKSLSRSAKVEDEGWPKLVGRIGLMGLSALWQAAVDRVRDVIRRR